MKCDFLMPSDDDNHANIIGKFLGSLVVLGYDVLKLLVLVKAFSFLYFGK